MSDTDKFMMAAQVTAATLLAVLALPQLVQGDTKYEPNWDPTLWTLGLCQRGMMMSSLACSSVGAFMQYLDLAMSGSGITGKLENTQIL